MLKMTFLLEKKYHPHHQKDQDLDKEKKNKEEVEELT